MYSLIMQVSEEASNSTAYKIGYVVGHFVGNHFYETLAGLLLIAGAILYFTVFRKKIWTGNRTV